LTITPGASFPAKILASMQYPSMTGTFTVLTSMVPTTTAGVDTTRVTVVAYPVNDPIDPNTHMGTHAASVVRDASGWQDDPTNDLGAVVPVTVNILVDNPTPGSESFNGQSGSSSYSGVRVELLGADPVKYPEQYYKTVQYALTDSFGTASFAAVPEGPYFVTCDPRFGPDLRPRYFPKKQNIAQGADNTVTLHVVRSVNTAVVRIGAFKGAGFTWSSPRLYYPNPLNPATGLFVTVTPDLPGGGTYANPALTDSLYTYSGTVNAFGVACINVDYTLESGQTWTARLRKANGTWVTLTDSCPGSWPDIMGSDGRSRYGLIDVPSSGNLPQWAELGN
jgi:hypothetical protein